MIRLAHLYCAITENLSLRLKTRCFGGGRKSRNDFSRSYRLKREGRRKWRLRRAYGCRARKLPTSTGVRAEGHSPRYKAYVTIQDCIKHQNLIAGGKSVDRKLMQTCAALVKQEARSTRADSTSTRARQLLRAKIPSGQTPRKGRRQGSLGAQKNGINAGAVKRKAWQRFFRFMLAAAHPKCICCRKRFGKLLHPAWKNLIFIFGLQNNR